MDKKSLDRFWDIDSWQILLSVIFIIAGGSVYLLFRSERLPLFFWLQTFSLLEPVELLRSKCSGIELNEFCLYSLPDGLWLSSYMLFANVFAPKENKAVFLFWICSLPILAILHEISQGLGFMPGVFDMADLVCYVIPLLINLKLLRYEKFI